MTEQSYTIRILDAPAYMPRRLPSPGKPTYTPAPIRNLARECARRLKPTKRQVEEAAAAMIREAQLAALLAASKKKAASIAKAKATKAAKAAAKATPATL